MKWQQRIKQIEIGENMLYGLVWTAILLIPILNSGLMAEYIIDYEKIVISWGKIAPYLIIFIINNFVLAPKLLLNNRYIWYSALLILMLIIIFGTIDILDFRYWQSIDTLRDKASFTDLEWYWNVCLGIFMAGANSMIKLYYRAIEVDQQLTRLEREHIETQMQYLKYQINPHFLMNTLNNIHAMIDFDGELAKQSVIELSHMLRHILYDSNEKTTTLDKEVEFIHNYIELMRLRYVDDVEISLNTPDMAICRKASLPPLMLVVLIENAFKHGISYNHKSFINIDISCDATSLCCEVTNSRHPSYNAQSSGIGLNNLTQRLKLIFGDKYSLKIDKSKTDIYSVKLVIPIIK